MKLTAGILTIFTIFLFSSCTRDKVTIGVVRHPAIKFNLSSSSAWQGNNTTFGPLTTVLVYPSDTTKPALRYTRFTLNSTGVTTKGETLQLVINFDVVDANQLIGLYSSSYSDQRGLGGVQIYNLTDNNNLMAYSLCMPGNIQPLFQVQRQNQTERLISGVFQMTVCNLRDSLQTINIINGTFTDTRY